MADRHQFRAEWLDYDDGIFFVTVCCGDKRHYFGEISDGEMHYTTAGQIVRTTVDQIVYHFSGVEMWNSVIMHNHLHLVLSIATVGTRHGASAWAPQPSDNIVHGASARAPQPTFTHNRLGCLKPKRGETDPYKDFHHNTRLAVIIGQLKSTVTRETNKRNIPFAWQTRYHEHAIRDQWSYENIMNYVDNNIANWCYDRFNGNRIITNKENKQDNGKTI